MTTASTLHRTTALVTALALVATALPFRSAGRTVAASQSPPPPAAPIALLDQIDGTVERASTPNWNLVRRAASLKGGLEPAFQLVRDEIAYEPYAGALRGAWGTYDSRAGNSVDRALVLAALLKQGGVRTRFALGRLGLPDRERLLQRVFELPAEIPSLPAETSRGFLDKVFQRASRDYRRVRAAIGSRLPPVSRPTRAEVLEEMNPHVWIQANSGGKWIDLDPSFPDARVGQALAAVDRTVDDLPEDLHQHVTIRVIAEQLSGGVLAQTTLMEVTRRAVDLNHTQIAVIHRQAQSASGLGGAIAGAFGRRPDQWTPALWIAGEFTFGRSFEPAAASFVAESIEFELQWPGGRREMTRRPLVDRGDASWRERLPLDATTLAPLARDRAGVSLDMQAVHNIWFSAGQHNLGDYLRALEELILETASTQPSQTGAAGDFGRSLWPFVLRNLTSVIVTDHVAVPMLNETPGVRVYADSPRISIFTTAPSEPDGIRVTTDFRRDHLRGLARPGSELALAEKKLQFGLFQGALEHEFLLHFAVATDGSGDGLSSTSSLLADSALTAVAPGTSGGPAIAGARSPSALVRRALRQGSMVVAPATGLDERGAWVEVDARTGDAHAVGGPGLHWTEFRGKGSKQANPAGGQKVHDLRPRAEKVAERNAKFYEELNARNAAERAAGRGNPASAQGNRGGGGMEYAILLTLGIIAGMAVWALSAYLEAKLYQECVKLIAWIADGGFRRAVKGAERLVGR